jgi:hypothetical protein
MRRKTAFLKVVPQYEEHTLNAQLDLYKRRVDSLEVLLLSLLNSLPKSILNTLPRNLITWKIFNTNRLKE